MLNFTNPHPQSTLHGGPHVPQIRGDLSPPLVLCPESGRGRRGILVLMSDQLQIAREAVAEGLTKLLGTWVVEGEIVRGPGSLAVLFRDHGETQSAEMEIGFWFNVG